MLSNNKFLNASGCWCSDENQINELYNSELGAVITKTCTYLPKNSNEEPTYYKLNDIHINSKGLPNPGYFYYKNLYEKFSGKKQFILSIAWEHNGKTIDLLKDYNSFVKKKELIELNLSCPNLNHNIPAYDDVLLDKILKMINNLKLHNLYFSLKLSPYLDHSLCDKIINVINNNENNIIKYVVLSNSIPNCLILSDNKPVLSNKYGGLSGKLNKFISLSNVTYFKDKLHKTIKIIGCGGIENIDDVRDYLNNGASYVQLASCFYDYNNNKLNIKKINDLIINFY